RFDAAAFPFVPAKIDGLPHGPVDMALGGLVGLEQGFDFLAESGVRAALAFKITDALLGGKVDRGLNNPFDELPPVWIQSMAPRRDVSFWRNSGHEAILRVRT